MNTANPVLLFDQVPAPSGAPFAAVLYALYGETLCALDFAGCEARMERLLKHRFGSYQRVAKKNPHGIGDRIAAYLSGRLHAIDDLPVSLAGSVFQRRAWLALREIPAGQTATYADQAASLGNAAAARAVGAANGRNPVAIVLPCHRVIGRNGALTGYAGGIETKAWLLRHEGAI